MRMSSLLAILATTCIATVAFADDWPQWQGPHRDSRATGFKAPSTWPKELSQKWKIEVGDGVATPALVGDKLFVFARQGGDEVVRCLEAASGKEIWIDKYAARGASGPASGFPGPRASPAVSGGKLVTFGCSGALTCYDATTGKILWRKDSTGGIPRFSTSASPLIVDGKVIVQLGGESGGSVTAFDLGSGDEKWAWKKDGSAYASPTMVKLEGMSVLIAETAKKIVALNLADGKELWEVPFVVTGRGYNASSPIVHEKTLIYGGSSRGTKAVTLGQEGHGLKAKEVWSNADNSVVYNSPVVKNGHVYALSSSDVLFCINSETGKTAWTQELKGAGGRSAGYGSIVDAGSVLVALNPGASLVVFQPNASAFKEVARYKVSEGGTYAYPVLDGNRIFIKDKNSVVLFTVN